MSIAPPPAGRLRGKVIVLVGAGQQPGRTIGNGRATAIRFAQEGAELILVDRDADALAATVADVEAEAAHAASVVVDVTADDAPDRVVGAAIDRYGRIDVLHNNVGIGAGDAPPHLLTDEVFDRIMDVNLRALWRICRAVIPPMRAQEYGVITNISSIASVAGTNIAAFRMSKVCQCRIGGSSAKLRVYFRHTSWPLFGRPRQLVTQRESAAIWTLSACRRTSQGSRKKPLPDGGWVWPRGVSQPLVTSRQ